VQDPVTLSADQILGIPLQAPERLFSGEASLAKRQFRALAALWHPDRNSGRQAGRVFAHITALYREVEEQIGEGAYRGAGAIRLTRTDGSTCQLRYLRRHAFELGDLYVGRSVLLYLIDPVHRHSYDRARRMAASFRFASPDMRAEVQRYLPSVESAFETADKLVLVLKKPPETVFLRDLLDHLGGRIDPRHVAWMISGLLSFCCYLEFSGLVHAAVSLDALLVSPPRHSTLIPGGWFHAYGAGARIETVPARTYEWIPKTLLKDRIATPRINLELVRVTGRELLGDISGAALPWDKSLPRPMVDWLNYPSARDAFTDYELWHEVLKDSFGARRFVELPVREADVYSYDGGYDGLR